MDDIRMRNNRVPSASPRHNGARRVQSAHAPRVQPERGVVPASARKTKRRVFAMPPKLSKKLPSRLRTLATILLTIFLTTMFIEFLLPWLQSQPFKAPPLSRELIPTPSEQYAKSMEYNSSEQRYEYNIGYSGVVNPESAMDAQGSPRFSAVFPSNAADGVTVNDPIHKVSMKLKPKYKLLPANQDMNQIVYKLGKKPGYVIYTAQAASVKEDIILSTYSGDEATFEYELELSEGLEARIENDGSLGVYGADGVLLGDVTSASEQDAKLLEQAKRNGEKNMLLFRVPAPFIVEVNKQPSKARASFTLQNNILGVHAIDLDKATYPLSIDPSVYVETAAKLMRGNNESNIDFDVQNELIQKGKTTGARFNEWNPTLSLNEGRWNQGTAVNGGYVYSVGGAKSNLITQVFDVAGTSSFIVPAGISSLSIKSWGGGGGGGGSSQDRTGGDGGGGGYAASTIAVTGNETLSIRVGGGGVGGDVTGSQFMGGGGAGGGYSGVVRGATPLVVAAGGGGGGGANGDTGSAARANGAAGRPGGGLSGTAGDSNSTTIGGGGGTQTTGGTGGAALGTAGTSLNGGRGGSQTGTYTVATTNGGGQGGNGQTGNPNNRRPGGGGGGGGIFGGGGGGAANARYHGGAGGGGGSSFTSGALATNSGGNGTAPGNPADVQRSGSGEGGAGAPAGNNSGSQGATGRVVISYSLSGATGDSTEATVTWARLGTVNNAIESPNPGGGTCTNWCSNDAYNLPGARKGLSVVAYNGFLYAFGGVDADGNRSNSIFVAKLGANGEFSLWHPTDTNKANWVYWYSIGSLVLPSELSYSAAVAYNNRMYLVGGQSNASSGGTSTVYVADINPTGTLSSWSTAGMAPIPSARHGHTAHVYNDRLYVIGGTSNGVLQNTVTYNKVNSNGTLNSWNSANNFRTGRTAVGGSFTTIWGGYIYLMGGCSAVNASGHCTTVANDIQLASINADGSISDWGDILGLTNERIGFGLVAWRNALYRIGGCTAQNPTTGDCTNTLSTSDYGIINPDGDASTVNNSVPSGTAPCSGLNPTNCDIPPAGDNAGQGGRMSSGVVINNGFIYVIGGCAVDAANTGSCNGGAQMSGNISYATIGSDGSIVQPASCTGTLYGSWCVDSTNRINGTAGLGTMAAAVFNNTIYLIGGTDGTNFLANIYRVGLNPDGSLAGAWQSQTFAGVGMGAARGYSLALTRANPAAANTNPGNLYVIGGCSSPSGGGIGCSTYFSDVFKCNIALNGTINGCTTAGQQQVDSEPTVGGVQGLGLMAGFIYANYIYLIGGSTPNSPERGQVMYARLDGNNNIVAVSGGIWQTSPNQLEPIRRRGFGFGYNGYLYSLAGYNPTDTLLNDLVYAKINVSDGSIGTFQTSKVTVSPRWDLRAIVSNGFVYAIGGCASGAAPAGCSGLEGSIQTFQLYNNDSGSPAAYLPGSSQFSVDPNRWGSSATVSNGYIYVAGGCISATDCTDATSNVQYAAIDSAGNIGSWASTTASLPADRAHGQLETIEGTLYYIGGQDDAGTAQTTVYFATPGTGGDTTAWVSAANNLPSARTKMGGTVWNGRLYITGGEIGGTVQTTVYVSPQLNFGGDITSAWTTATAFNIARSGHTTIAYANNLYTLGGFNGTNFLNDVQYNKINANGSLASWTDTTSLPQRISGADGFAANGFMYLFGGRSASTVCTNNTYIAPISANTTIASGNNPTGIGEWYQTNVKFNGVRYGAATAYSDGRAYVLGGGCTAPLAADQQFMTALKSQPQIAKYSRMIDTDTDVFPTKWLMNGLDNDIGARWKMRYRSSTAATAAWGQETNFGTVTLGQPEDYIPLDASGFDSNFARYYYLSISIDSSQTFGYPEDVLRGPTITDISLFFTSDPSKRLRHGKTFTGGEQQPLDTPCRNPINPEDSDCTP